jgi:hypothetical protein
MPLSFSSDSFFISVCSIIRFLVSVEVAWATYVFMLLGELRLRMLLDVARNEIAVGFQDRLYLLKAVQLFAVSLLTVTC